MNKPPRKPRRIKLDEKPAKAASKPASAARKPLAQTDMAKVKPVDDAAVHQLIDDLQVAPQQPPKRGLSWGALLFAAIGGLFSLGIGLAIDQLIRDLFERHDWLGWAAAALAFVLVVAALAIALREIWGISRLNTISKLRDRAVLIHSGERPAEGGKLVNDLAALYAGRPDLANARAQFSRDSQGILDGQDLLELFETTYLGPVDKQASALVMQSAKRVSLVTAISPRALVDIAYVLMENTRLIRKISYLYGGKPGALGFWKLTRNVLGHLAVTGAIAAGDSLIQQFVGHGVAARISTKLGEGVVNGLLTARIGIAAMDQARPMEFNAVARPGLSEYFNALSGAFKSEKTDA